MKNLITSLSFVLLLGIGLISLSQVTSPGTVGKGANIAGCQLCIESLVASIKSTVGSIIVGGGTGSELARQVVVIVGVPVERANQLVNDFNNCCLDNGCSTAPLLVVR